MWMDMEVKIRQAITESGRALGVLQLKSKQFEALNAFLSGRDTFVSLPTGYGKSIIYAVLPLAFDFLKGKSLLSCGYQLCILVSQT